jgi:hypothetical protein
MEVFFISFLPSHHYSGGVKILKERQTIWRVTGKIRSM